MSSFPIAPMETLSFQLEIKDTVAYTAALKRKAERKIEHAKPMIPEDALSAAAEAIAYGFRNFGLDASASGNLVNVICATDEIVRSVRETVRTEVTLPNGLEIAEV